MKLTIMNPSFKNETVIYNHGSRKNRMEIITPEKQKYEVMSAQLLEDGKVFSSKDSAYSSVASKRRSKNERRLGFGSFGQESFLAKINKAGSPTHTKSIVLVDNKSPSENRISRTQRRQLSENKRVVSEVQDIDIVVLDNQKNGVDSFHQEGNTGGEFNEDDDSSMNSL